MKNAWSFVPDAALTAMSPVSCAATIVPGAGGCMPVMPAPADNNE
jgi:hypothetical protein